MIYGSICSGITAESVAWKALGWKCAFYSDIEPFSRALLSQRYPNIPLHGDFTTIQDGQYEKVDLLIGGTPCQDFSVAGLRAGIAGERGNLTLEYVRLIERLKPTWVIWENVPGVLSVDGGRALGAFLGALAQLGYGWAYRILDAKHFGVPHRRRRIYLVGYFGSREYPAKVLFEQEGLFGHSSTIREAGTIASALTANGVGAGGGPDDNAAQANHLIPVVNGSGQIAVSFSQNQIGEIRESSVSMTLNTNSNSSGRNAPLVRTNVVRRLTPVECERLMGFPDGYTNILYRGKPAADGPRYRALGNSVVVPVLCWIGERIEAVNR